LVLANLDPQALRPVTPRLYCATRPLFLAVAQMLNVLGIAAIGSPTTVGLIGPYVTGLILLDARQPRYA
jgi:hypothetical protein